MSYPLHRSNDFRRGERLRSYAPARLVDGQRVIEEFPIVDISETGCRIRSHQSGLEQGVPVNLMIETFGPIAGEVVWRNGSFIGVRFAARLSPAVVRHIQEALDRMVASVSASSKGSGRT